MYEFLLPKPFERQMMAEVLEYEGRATVGDVLCHVVYAEFDRRPDGRIRRQRWFIGTKDNLPRKVETIVADDKGRYGAYELTLTNLRADVPISPQAFVVQLPKGYKIKDYEPPKRPELLAVGETAPEWTLTDSSGKAHTLSSYRGKVVVLDFWATWCGPCVKTMPEIQTLYDKFKGRGVEVFGVNAWEESNSPVYFKEKGYTYGLLLNGETITKSYRVSNLPTIYVIGNKGEIIYRSVMPDSNLTAAIEQYLKEN
jgi:thiol-disulfide isomerase/thioredoxin